MEDEMKGYARIIAVLMATMIAVQSLGIQVQAADYSENNLQTEDMQNETNDDSQSDDQEQIEQEADSQNKDEIELPSNDDASSTESQEDSDSSNTSNQTEESEQTVPDQSGSEETTSEQELNDDESIVEESEEESADSEELEMVEEDEQELLEATSEDTYSVSEDDILIEFIPGSSFDGTINIPEGVVSVAADCLNNLKTEDAEKITKVIFPESLNTIPNGTFSKCVNLSSIEFLSTSSLNVKGEAFSGCNLTDIKLTNGLQSIPARFLSKAGFGPNATIHIPASVRTIGTSAFETFDSPTYTIAVLDFESGSKLKSISTDAFQNCTSIQSINFPASLSGIGSYSFMGCTNLSSITFEDNSALASIGYEAFYNCKVLSSITIPENVTTIYDEAFKNTGLTSVTIKSTKLNSEYNNIFQGCKISSVVFAEGITTIPKIFYHAGFTTGATVTIPASAKKINSYAFNSTAIGTVVFEGTNVTEIGSYAFEDCTSLTTCDLPSNLRTLGVGAFKGCTSLSSICIPETMTAVPKSAFENCLKASSLTIGSKVKSIGENAFYGCRSLTELTIPNNVTSIGKSAFNRCTGLNKLTVSSNVTSLPYRALGYLTSLDELYLGNNISSVMNGAECALEGTDQASLNIYVSSTSSRTYNALKAAAKNGWITLDQIIASTSLSYQLNGGLAVGTYPSSYLADSESATTIMLRHPTRTGYVFAGWYLDAKFTKAIGRNYNKYSYIPINQLTGNTKLYAKWIGPTFYEVTFDAAGGTVTPTSITVALKGTYGEHNSITEFGFPTPTAPENKKFIGWYNENNELITASSVVGKDADGQTLTAKYISNVQSVDSPEIKAVGYDSISDGDTVEKGTKLYFTCDTDGAEITYTITDIESSTIYKDGIYSGNVTLSKAGNYKVAVSAKMDGVDSTETTMNLIVEDDTAPAGYSEDKANKLWVQYKNTEEWDETTVSKVYTGSTITFNEGSSYDYVVYYGKTRLVLGTDYTVSYSNNKVVANYDATNSKGVSIAPTMVIKGKGSISGTVKYRFSVINHADNAIALNGNNTIFTLDTTGLAYNGKDKKPTVTIKYKKTGEEIPSSEYTVVYTNNKNAGTAKATITFNGISYYGTLTKSFSIAKLNFKQASTDDEHAIKIVKEDSITYDKSNINGLVSMTLVSTGDKLIENIDYTKKITTSTNNKTGVITATMKLTGKGNYTGTTSFTYTVEKQSIDNVSVTSILGPVYTGKKNVYKPVSYTVKDGSATLKNGTDYTVDAKSFKVKLPGASTFEDVDTKTVYPAGSEVQMTIVGKGFYNSTKDFSYFIESSYQFTDAGLVDVTVGNVTYSNKANICRPKVTVKNLYTGKVIGSGSYTVSNYRYVKETVVSRIVNRKVTYKIVEAGTVVDKTDIIPAGTEIFVDITGKGQYSGTVTHKFKFIYDMSKASISVAKQTYSGYAVVPEKSDITIKIGSTVLKPTDYEIVSCTNNTKAGNAKITIKGNGAFSGTKTVTYKIVAKKL